MRNNELEITKNLSIFSLFKDNEWYHNYDCGYLYPLVHEVSLNKDRLRSSYVTVKHKHERFRVIIKCAVVSRKRETEREREITILQQDSSKPKAIAKSSNCARLQNVLKNEHTSIQKRERNGEKKKESIEILEILSSKRDRRRLWITSGSGRRYILIRDLFLFEQKKPWFQGVWQNLVILCAWIVRVPGWERLLLLLFLLLKYHHILVWRRPSRAEGRQKW